MPEMCRASLCAHTCRPLNKLQPSCARNLHAAIACVQAKLGTLHFRICIQCSPPSSPNNKAQAGTYAHGFRHGLARGLYNGPAISRTIRSTTALLLLTDIYRGIDPQP